MFHARPSFDDLIKGYPSTQKLSREELFKSIGWDRELDNPAFADTCAIRGSLGLLSVGVPVRGRVKVLKGQYKDKWIEPGQRNLTLWLAEHWWGPPDEKLSSSKIAKLAGRPGIISHFRIDPASRISQGHFDVLDPSAEDPMACASHCFWAAAETWFWLLPRGILKR